MQLCYLTDDAAFPEPETALNEPNGLLAVGGDLSTERLISAYYHGIFPWYNAGEPILWWSPNPRAIIYPQNLHISRSLKKQFRQTPYRITLNHSFADVIHQCALFRQEGTWIGPEMRTAYLQLHYRGIAHSVEVWQQEQLIGGLYGISLGRIFCGESMFSRQSNAAKYALAALCQHLNQHDFKLIDSQVINPFTESLGAIEIDRSDYLAQLKQYRDIPPLKPCWDVQELVIRQ
jgi:leucyl/phenylalanyl-tRNA--protein transferase